ncbi:NUDIX domain-containing protein [Alteraurantiacibacter palmitatis]|uniref:NUDIX domain-containing protein n=1 Tax=Alteraurantiacibacter palmitatis TaxID=2054628 RepID=A0ABV7E268_9SPHN
MLHLIPASLHRQLYRVAHRLRGLWLRLRGGEVHGCSIIARDATGRVLLVRHSYGSGWWAFPGGGMHRGEDALAAALREFAEELGCTVTDPVHLATVEEMFHGARNVAHIFTGLIDGEPLPDGREIIAAQFFAPDALPPDTAPNVQRRLALLTPTTG